MSVTTVVLVAAGVVVNGLTFVLGLAVGERLKRKDSRDDNSNENKSEEISRERDAACR